METRTYTEKSNARRAARAAGVDVNLITESEDGFTFPMPAEPETNGRDYQKGNGVDAEVSADQMRAAHAEAEAAPDDLVDTPAPRVVEDDGIPAFCKISAEERKAAWASNPPKAAPIRETILMAKAKKTKQPKIDKTATLLSMLKGKGSTVVELTKATGWLAHTLRARISGLAKPKSKGGSHDVENIITLCPNHHAMVHAGLIPKADLVAAITNPIPEHQWLDQARNIVEYRNDPK